MENAGEMLETSAPKKNPIFSVCKNGDRDTLLQMLRDEQDVNVTNAQGSTPLIVACLGGKTDVAHLLIERGAEKDFSGPSQWTALHAAAFYGHISTVDLLIQKGADVTKRTDTGRLPGEDFDKGVPIETATEIHERLQREREKKNALEEAESLLYNKASEVNVQDCVGNTPLISASTNGCLDIVKELLSNGAEVNAKGMLQGETALIQASMNGHTNIVKELLLNRANVNMQDMSGYNALFWASSNGHIDIVKELLLNGAKVNAQDESGYSDLIRQMGGIDLCFPEEGALSFCEDEFGAGLTTLGGLTTLMAATIYGHTDIVKELLLKGAEVNATSNYMGEGITALMWASCEGHADIVKELLLNGAEVNAKGNVMGEGVTALIWAVQKNYSTITELLLKHGAVADLSLLSIAKERALSKVASLLAMQLGDDKEAFLLEKGCFYPVFVCEVNAFLQMTGLMKHEEALRLGYVVMLPAGAKVVFFSHRWLNGSRSKEDGGAHPDREDAYKYNAMVYAIQNEFTQATHVWVDFLCVPQEDPHTQLLAINSLPFIVRQCVDFVVLHGVSEMSNKNGEDEASFAVYNSRGWCRLECLSAIAPLEEEGQEIRKWRLDMNTKTVEQPSLFDEDLSIFNPFGQGAVFFDSSDKNKIALMVYNLAQRFKNDFGIGESAVEFFPEDLQEKYKKQGSI